MTHRLVVFAEHARALGAVCMEVGHQRILPRTLMWFELPDNDAADAFVDAARRAGVQVTNRAGGQVTVVVDDDAVGGLYAGLGSGQQEIGGPR